MIYHNNRIYLRICVCVNLIYSIFYLLSNDYTARLNLDGVNPVDLLAQLGSDIDVTSFN